MTQTVASLLNHSDVRRVLDVFTALSESADFNLFLDRKVREAAGKLTDGTTFVSRFSKEENNADADYRADLRIRHIIRERGDHQVFKEVVASEIGSLSWSGWTTNGQPHGFLQFNMGPHHITNSVWVVKDGTPSVAFLQIEYPVNHCGQDFAFGYRANEGKWRLGNPGERGVQDTLWESLYGAFGEEREYHSILSDLIWAKSAPTQKVAAPTHGTIPVYPAAALIPPPQ